MGLYKCASGTSVPVLAQNSFQSKGTWKNFWFILIFIFLLCFFHFKQFKKHKEIGKEPGVALDSVFTPLLKKAYERGSNTLLEDDIQTKLRDLASQVPPEQLLLGVKQVLLYLKSTVENFGSVRAMLWWYYGLVYLILKQKVRMTWLLKCNNSILVFCHVLSSHWYYRATGKPAPNLWTNICPNCWGVLDLLCMGYLTDLCVVQINSRF